MNEKHPTMDAADVLHAMIEANDIEPLQEYVYNLSSGELARAVSLLEPEHQSHLLMTLPPETAAFLIDQLAHPQAADLLEELPAEQAAAIIDEMPSDEQADVFGEIESDEAEAILQRMDPDEAQDVRLLSQYPANTAGGLMITEYLAYPEHMTVDDALADVRANADEYAEYDVQYMYVVSPEHELRGVARIRDMVLSRGKAKLSDIMIRTPRHVRVTDNLDTLEEFFDANYFNAVPVLEENTDRLLGVVRRAMVEEALGERADIQLLRFGGIIAGEELRTMPLPGRAMRRLAFLLPNILLSFFAVTIIAFYEESIETLAVLAVFLPLVANLSGAAGNQAVAVSIRELALGVVQPRDWIRVCLKEVKVGAINGLIIGAILCTIAFFMRPDMILLATIVGAAYAINSVLSVLIGGTIPLAAKALGADPAMISSPILTTLTDMGAFFLTLFMATAFLISTMPPT